MSAQTTARVIGVLSLIAFACGSFPLYVDGQLVVPGDAEQTAANLVASETLFRLGVVSMLALNAVYLFAVLGWYALLRPVHASLALTMLVLILTSFPIAMTNELNRMAALELAQAQQPAQMAVALDLHAHGLLIAGIFAGLWLFPLGLLVYRSGFLPRVLGAMLMLGSLGYLIRFFQGFVFPGAEATLWTNPFLVFTHVAELSTMLWLLVKGVRTAR